MFYRTGKHGTVAKEVYLLFRQNQKQSFPYGLLRETKVDVTSGSFESGVNCLTSVGDRNTVNEHD